MRDSAPIAAPMVNATIGIERVLEIAVEKGMGPEGLEKLVALHERMTANAARRQFSAAMAAFKAECPPIPRRTENGQFKVTNNGITRNRRYAALDDIEKTIREPLGRHGLSFRWGDAVIRDGSMTLTCIVSHPGGHSESSSVSMPIESRAGCSDQQKYGSAGTYAQRYSLIQVLGLTTCDDDDDGQGLPETTITEHQAANLEALIAEVNADKGRFLRFYSVERLEDLPASQFQSAVRALEAKRGGNK
jgi:hypothetical protein